MRHWEKLSEAELIEACKYRGYDTGGDNEDLIARLKGRGQPAPPPEPEPEPEPTDE